MPNLVIDRTEIRDVAGHRSRKINLLTFFFISMHISLVLFFAVSARTRWELEWPFDGQLCQEYSYQKLSKSNNPSSGYNR